MKEGLSANATDSHASNVRLRLPEFTRALSPGAWIILTLAVASTIGVLFTPIVKPVGRGFWTFAQQQYVIYKPRAEEWNRHNPQNPVTLSLIQYQAYQRRMLSGFFSGTPVADLLEVERLIVGQAFTGPLEDVGFADLTDVLRAEGWMEKINAPSFGPWTSRGRIFGIPHDIHPMMLAYRADLVEAAGIDVSKIETWDDYFEALKPLIRDENGDGRPDRWLLNFWPTQRDTIEPFLLQAGGRFFDEQDRPAISSEINAQVLATLVTWCVGPRRMCVDATEFTAAGDQMRIDGSCLASVMPDWLAGIWVRQIPALAGKVKVMPLPAFTRGGLRTSVWGGSMLALSRRTENFQQSWELAKQFYLTPESAEALYRGTRILTPVKEFWSLPVFQQPDPYFCGQKIAQEYIALAPHVPVRTSSPFNVVALGLYADALVSLRDYAVREERHTVADLLPQARRLLEGAQRDLERQINRNRFYHQTPATASR